MKLLLMSPHHSILYALKQLSNATKSKTFSKSIKSIYFHLHLVLLLLVTLAPLSQATKSCISIYPNGCH